MEATRMSGGEEFEKIRVLRGTISRSDLHDRSETHFHLLHDYPHHSLHSSLTAHSRLILAASRDAGQDTSRYDEPACLDTTIV